VIKQARAAASCHRGSGSGISPLDLDEYFYGGGDLGFTKPFVDDRYSYCLRNHPRHHSVCTAVQAKGDKVVRITIDTTGTVTDLKYLMSSTFAQAVTDRLVA
jgi:hypothetical protein